MAMSDAELVRAVAEAEPAIRPFVRQTPLLDPGGDIAPHGRVLLKLELLQHSGSFKARGAFANLVLRKVPAAGVAAASGGNHGAAVAYAARRLGVPATIFVPTISSPAKIARIRAYGADLVVGGESYGDAAAACERWSEGRDVLSVHAFDQRETIAGQGTIALELEKQLPETTTVLVPVGGGGLLAGVASWYGHRVRLVPVEPERSPTLTRALAAGEPVDADVGGIAADSLAPKRVGGRVYDIVSKIVDRTVLVSDDDIRNAQRWLWDRTRLVAEPGGAAALAALLSRQYEPAAHETVVVLLTGGNSTAVTLDAAPISS
jgi:threonine dehydratase